MRILGICMRSYVGMPGVGVGGAERMLHSLLSHLVREGWSASAAVFGRPREHVVVDGVNVYRRKTDTDVGDLAANCDVIISHLGSTNAAKRIGKTFNKPVVQLIHNTNEYTQGFLGGGCDFAVYNSQWVKEHLESHKPGIVRHITSGTTYQLKLRAQDEWPGVIVRPPVLSGDLRTGGGPSGYVTLVNLVPNKGPDVFYHLAEQNPDIKFRGVIGGYEENHQVIRELLNVDIHPHTRDMSEVYSEASVILMPSVYESYGLVAVEGLQYGVPSIVSTTPGLQESMGSAGWFRAREDLDGWNSALRWTLDNYDVRSKAAHERHLELYGQSQIELAEFSREMTEVASGNYRDRGCRDGTGRVDSCRR